MKRATLILLLLGGLDILLRVYVALRPIAFIDGMLLPDDTYLSLTIAKNIAAGLGPLYGLAHTNGFQPLYVFLATPLFWLFPSGGEPPVHGALLLLAAFDLATLIVLYRFVLRTTSSLMAATVTATAWVLGPVVMQNTLNGLETAVSVFFILASYVWCYRLLQERNDLPSLRQAALAGILLGFALFARIDNGFLVAAMGLWFIYAAVTRRWPLKRSLFTAAVVILAVVLVNLPWWLYSLYYTGRMYPISGPAIRFMATSGFEPGLYNWYLPLLHKAMQIFWHQQHWWLLVAAAALAVAFGAKGRRGLGKQLHRLVSPHLFLIIWGLSLFLSYVLYGYAYWFYGRYLFPLIIPVLILMGQMLAAAFTSLNDNPKLRTGLFAALLALVATVSVTDARFSALLTSTDSTSLGYMNIGLWAKQQFPPGTVVGSSQTGGLGYFADTLTVVNLDGVVNEACYRSMLDKENLSYIRRVGVQYIFGWELNINFIKTNSRGFSPDDIKMLGRVEGFTSWNKPWFVYQVMPSTGTP